MASASSVGAPPAQRPRLRKQVSGRRPASKRERLSQRRSDLGTDQRNTRQHTNGLDEVLEYGADATYQRAEGERLPSDEDDAGASASVFTTIERERFWVPGSGVNVGVAVGVPVGG